MIRRLTPGYNGGVSALHSKESINEKKLRYCSRCEDLFQVQSILGNKILGIGEVKHSDYDLWLQCRNCGSLYQKNEVKVEPDLDSVKVPSDGQKGKVQGVEKKPKKRISRGNNPRLKSNRWEIKDTDLQRELRDGAELIAYYSNEPLK
jgi:DNA-directed RNA polymerase subunit M/transcription elongation factor TFIIS